MASKRLGDLMSSGCTSLVAFTVPELVGTNVASAFAGCTSLKSATLPTSLQTIGLKAFEGCGGLEEGNFQISSPPPESVSLGSGVSAATSATIPLPVAFGRRNLRVRVSEVNFASPGPFSVASPASAF